MNKTFCIVPWIHMHVWPNGKVYQCCMTHWSKPAGHLENNSLEEVWNNDYMKGLRKSMLAGEDHGSCDKCLQREEHGFGSPRISLNERFAHHIPAAQEKTLPDGTYPDFQLLYWDFRFSNICNFKCRMCGPMLSSSWREDQEEIYGAMGSKEKVIEIKNHSKVDLQKYLDEYIDKVEEVYFAGGEPLMMEEHFYILERLIETGNTSCRLRYNTNLSRLHYKDWDWLEMLKHFSDVRIGASIDGIDENAEYSRSGTRWKKIEQNIQEVGKATHLSVSATINIFNIMQIPQLVERLIELGVDYKRMNLSNVLVNPAHYHINILPDDLKIRAYNWMNMHLEEMDEEKRAFFASQYESIRNMMWQAPENVEDLRQEFKRHTLILDAKRNERFQDACPELAEWFDSI